MNVQTEETGSYGKKHQETRFEHNLNVWCTLKQCQCSIDLLFDWRLMARQDKIGQFVSFSQGKRQLPRLNMANETTSQTLKLITTGDTDTLHLNKLHY